MASSPGDASAGTPSPRRHVIVTISAPRPSERPKLGHDLRATHATVLREKHLAQTPRDPELKHTLNFRTGREADRRDRDAR